LPEVAADRHDRKAERHQVHLSVSYQSAQEFVAEYAENLSAGGLFIRGAHELEILSEIAVDIELPGLGRYTVTGQVAHILTPEVAARNGRKPGAGIAIVRSPPEFTSALATYLARLGRRRDVAVLVVDEAMRKALEDAGYVALPAPPPGALAAAIARADMPVLGVAVPRDRADAYRAAARACGAGDIVCELDYAEELGDLLRRLDDEL
jgi:Tfp pilus assembly protein PilZ